VRRFLEARRLQASTLEVAVQLIASPANRHEAARFAATWADAGASVMIKEPRDWAGQVRLPGLEHGRASSAPCKMPWTELTVLWDGKVVPCANHYEQVNVLGDLEHETLDEVWRGPALAALRAAHLGGAVDGVPVCRDCPRHPLDAQDFVAVDQLEQRRRSYLSGPGDLTPRPGLS
jgi:radical SAM protein with 4Fe4S-binding SPASM domain